MGQNVTLKRVIPTADGTTTMTDDWEVQPDAATESPHAVIHGACSSGPFWISASPALALGRCPGCRVPVPAWILSLLELRPLAPNGAGEARNG